MLTYLLTWNPKRWPWDAFEEDLAKFRRKGFLDDQWSCGLQGNIQKGDRIFLLKQGPWEPKGIFASGYATSARFTGPHWDTKKAATRKRANYVKIKFDQLLDYDEQIIPRSELKERRFSDMHWDTQMSGVRIPERIAVELELEWATLLGTTPMSQEFESEAVEGILIETTTYTRKRDGRLRREAVNKAGGVCEVCAVDFSKIWRGKGTRVLHVHHKKQLGIYDKPRLTKLSDLAVVCANCHMLIHYNPAKAMSVEAVRKILKT